MARRRRKDDVNKWKLKRWYEVVAPSLFEEKVMGEIISSDPNNLINRIVPIPLSEVISTKKPEALYSTLHFRVKDVKNDKAYTDIIGMEMAFSYLRSLARRRRTVIHEVIDITTKDGKTVRLKFLVVTLKKVSSTVKKNLRKALNEKVRDLTQSKSYYELVNSIVNGSLSSELAKHLNVINPVGVVLVKKFELFEQFA